MSYNEQLDSWRLDCRADMVGGKTVTGLQCESDMSLALVQGHDASKLIHVTRAISSPYKPGSCPSLQCLR